MEEARERNLYRLALEQMQEGIILSDEDATILFVNDAAERIRNVRKEDILGRSMLLCHKESSREKVGRALDFLKAHEGKSFRRMVTDKVNDKIYENVYAPLFDREGAFRGVAVVSHDVTERRRDEEMKATSMRAQEVALESLRAQYHTLTMSAMEMLINLLETRDLYTDGHSKRVSELAAKLYEHRFGITERYLDVLWAAKLHDIGKICIPDAIVGKPGKLTAEEYETIKRHSNIAADIIQSIGPGDRIAPIVRHHHERFDGKGYPDGCTARTSRTARA
jgi:PAS domain S-box-containing protein/putative nucleotidyltransferase with HDIG domain